MNQHESGPSPASQTNAQSFDRRIQAASSARQVLARAERLAVWVTTAFAALGILFPLAVFEGAIAISWPLGLLGYAVPLAGLVAWRGQKTERREDVDFRIDYLQSRKAAHAGECSRRGSAEVPAEAAAGHPYALDLDLFGRESFFARLATRASPLGERALIGRLLAEALPGTRAERAAAIRELSEAVEFREALAVQQARVAREMGATDASLVRARAAWLALPDLFANRGQEAVPRALPIFASIAGFAVVFGLACVQVIPAWPVFAWLLLHLIWLTATRDLGEIAARVSGLPSALEPAARLFGVVFASRWQSAILCDLRERICAVSNPVAAVAKLKDAVRLLEARANPFHRFSLGLATLSDLRARRRLLAFEADHGPRFQEQMLALAELEALVTLSEWVDAEQRGTEALPPTAEASVRLDQLRHPLIPRQKAVANDLEVKEASSLLLITGSNMSGKSTFLRAVGLAAFAAHQGLLVAAEKAHLPEFRIVTCMRVQDSLAEGKSRFAAEVARLALAVRRAREQGPALVLLDEILSGTNSEDRHKGTEAVLRALMQTQSLVMVSTHDLALTALADEYGSRARCVHFRDEVQAGVLHFDYTMRPGPCPTSNALSLLIAAGLMDANPGVRDPAR